MMNVTTANLVRILAVALLVTSCGGAAQPVQAQSVLDRFIAAGLTVDSPEAPAREPDSPLPNVYAERMTFVIPGAREGRGGQVFTCESKKNCDALVAYFDALKALVGPYLYQSPSGTVVVQLNSGLPPDVAARYEAVVKNLP